MQALTYDAEGLPSPGPEETWEELAEHSLLCDDLPLEAAA